MSKKRLIKNNEKNTGKKRWFLDIFVVFFCLAGAAVSLNLFRIDLFQTIASHNQEPVGTVTIRNNNVQRRLSDRVLWGRLLAESPVYLGDLIRVAELSSATLHIADNNIDLNENTLIRILGSADSAGNIMLDLSSGSLNLFSGVSGGIELNLTGSRVTANPGTLLSAAAGESGMSVQVNEGSVEITADDGQSLTLDTGEMLALDANGIERVEPAAVVTQPRPNARLLNNTGEPLAVRFSWITIDIEAGQSLLLEIAEDRNFSRIARRIEGASAAAANLNVGIWYWRLSFENSVLNTGQLTVVASQGAAPVSPAQDSLFFYKDNLPTLYFEWQELEGASSYIFEAGRTPDFRNPQMTRQTATASIVDSNMGEGIWYWRVLPVFSSLYEGNAAYSSVASFRVEQSREPEAPVRPPPPLPEPPQEDRFPADEHQVKIEELRDERKIDFSWSAVSGANAYIFSLHHSQSQEAGGSDERRQVLRTDPLLDTNWTLDNLSILDHGTFIWQVEAVNMNRDGAIEQRGRVAENSFVVDIPAPSLPEINNIETLYGQ